VARIEQADAQVRVAGAALLPSVDAGGNVARSRGARTTTSGARPEARTLYGANLAATYEIDFWGKNRAARQSAQSTARATRFDKETIALSVMASVAATYFQILAAEARMKIAESNVRIAERSLEAFRARASVGTATALDIAQQEGVVLQQRAQIPPLRQQIRQNTNALAILTGRTPDRITVTGGSFDRIALPQVGAGLPSELLARRPDIAEAEARLAAAEANVVVARAQMFPSIELTAAGGIQSGAFRALFDPAATFWTLAAQLSQPIFDGGRLRAQLESERARYDELVQTYRLAVISAFRDVEDALVAIEETAEQERLQQAVVATARRAQTISEARLREGTIDLLTLLNTQQTLFQAQDALARIRLDRLQAAIDLYQALGGGWSQPATAPRPTG
ncbi:MAG: efflux transporter outer membrane subunit, partial [Alphaproteobacteria bacterium]